MEHHQKLKILLTFLYERNFLLTISLQCFAISYIMVLLKNNCHITNVLEEVNI